MLNGKKVHVDAPDDLSVLWALRDRLGVTGPKYGCGIDVCKACTSHLDGKPFNPCATYLRDLGPGAKVTTIEGLADGDELHPVQQAWLEQDVAQCGYCQPGQIMAAAALLERGGEPTDEEIDAIDNVCRCGTYVRIREAIKRAAEIMVERGQRPAVPAGGAGGAGATTAAAALLAGALASRAGTAPEPGTA
jgi:isoquinoline 1-oxidoreductase alpha subunit